MGTINDLNTVNTVADDDKFVLWKEQAGSTRAITAVDLATYFGAELSDEYQPLDATLTALAGAGFENGRVLLGTGVDTVSNVLPGALPVTATSSTTARTLADRFANWKTPLDYGAVGDGAADDLAAFVAWHAASEAEPGGVPLYLPGGYIFRVTGSIDLTDAVQPAVIRGAGRNSVGIYGDFIGAGDAIVDISFSTDANRITGHHLEGFALWGNRVVGDPMGIKSLAMQEATIRDIQVPGLGNTILGGVRGLYNVGVFATKVNNGELDKLQLRSGYQPQGEFVLPNGARFSMTGGDQTLTSDTAATFTAGMVGETIILSTGGGTADSTDYWFTTIASFTDAQNVELTDAAPATFSDAKASVGLLTGSISNADQTLTVNAPVLTSAHEGMPIFIPLAWQNPNASNTLGLLCTSIASVTNSTTCELADAAEANVTDLPIFFAPALFVGKLRSEDSDNRNTNDLVMDDIQIEGRTMGVGAIFQDVFETKLINSKIEIAAIDGGNNFAFQQHSMVLSAVRDFEFTGGMNYSFSTRGNVWVMGSRGSARFNDLEQQAILPDAHIIYVDEQNTSKLRVSVGNGWITDGVAKHSAGWAPIRVPATLLGSAEYTGYLGVRNGSQRFGRPLVHPGYVSGRYYWGNGLTPSTPSAAQTADRLYLTPIQIHHRVLVDKLTARVSTGVAATNVKLAVYESIPDSNTGEFRPGRRIMYTAAIATTAASGVEADPIGQEIIEPGIYWFGCQTDGATEMRSIATADRHIAPLVGGSTVDAVFGNSGQVLGILITAAYASGVPDNITNSVFTQILTATVPVVGFKAG